MWDWIHANSADTYRTRASIDWYRRRRDCYGVLAPVNYWFPGKVSTISFVLVSVWIDAP